MQGSIDRRTALTLLMATAALPAQAWAQGPKAGGATVQALDAAARGELADKAIPSIAIALVDRSGVLWAGGWGFEDQEKTRPATASSLYRAGAAGRFALDLMIRQLVDAGRMDLDAPAATYFPDFAPQNPFGAPVTVRQLSDHTSGLVRDPPAGNAFDLREASGVQLNASLTNTRLLFKPGTQTKFSEAGLGVLALMVAAGWRSPLALVAREKLFKPLGMASSGYSASQAGGSLVYAELGSYDGGRTPAPLVQEDAQLGGLHSTAADMGLLVKALLNQPAGKAPGPELEAREVAGKPSVGQGGSVLGSTAEVRLMPQEGLGVVVLAALNDCPSARRLADYGLELLLAARAGSAPPAFPRSQRVGMAQAKALSGHFADGGDSLFLRELEGGLLVEGPRLAGEVRRLGARHVVDDAQAFSDAIEIDPQGQWVKLEGRTFARGDWARPAPPPEVLAPLIGEYGFDHGYIRVFERDGRPCVRVGWADYEPMAQAGPDELAFDPKAGAYRLESLKFTRDDKGQVQTASLNGMLFQRREFGLEMLERTRAMAKDNPGLRARAKAATPPQEAAKAAPDLVPLTAGDPSIKLDIRYATANNFMGFPLYARPGAYMQRPAAEAVARASQALHAQGFGLIIHDGYRPWFVTKMFWDATPPEGHVFVADPSQGSRHNRGCAVDLSLYDLKTGEEVQMTGFFDEMSARSYPQYVGGSSLQRWRRDLLRQAMEAQGFEVYSAEWWHFDFNGWDRYPILDLDFDQIDKQRAKARRRT